ncbi:unnamed protein product [Amoebophrya sp. A120]|nr:unnamed protein product [Amoebophrya sp. A120]|eukprot:GSA120T00013464001.1
MDQHSTAQQTSPQQPQLPTFLKAVSKNRNNLTTGILFQQQQPQGSGNGSNSGNNNSATTFNGDQYNNGGKRQKIASENGVSAVFPTSATKILANNGPQVHTSNSIPQSQITNNSGVSPAVQAQEFSFLRFLRSTFTSVTGGSSVAGENNNYSLSQQSTQSAGTTSSYHRGGNFGNGSDRTSPVKKGFSSPAKNTSPAKNKNTQQQQGGSAVKRSLIFSTRNSKSNSPKKQIGSQGASSSTYSDNSNGTTVTTASTSFNTTSNYDGAATVGSSQQLNSSYHESDFAAGGGSAQMQTPSKNNQKSIDKHVFQTPNKSPAGRRSMLDGCVPHRNNRDQNSSTTTAQNNNTVTPKKLPSYENSNYTGSNNNYASSGGNVAHEERSSSTNFQHEKPSSGASGTATAADNRKWILDEQSGTLIEVFGAGSSTSQGLKRGSPYDEAEKIRNNSASRAALVPATYNAASSSTSSAEANLKFTTPMKDKEEDSLTAQHGSNAVPKKSPQPEKSPQQTASLKKARSMATEVSLDDILEEAMNFKKEPFVFSANGRRSWVGGNNSNGGEKGDTASKNPKPKRRALADKTNVVAVQKELFAKAQQLGGAFSSSKQNDPSKQAAKPTSATRIANDPTTPPLTENLVAKDTAIILDWDDTLFPTTMLKMQVPPQYVSTPNGVRQAPVNEEFDSYCLNVLGPMVIKFLEDLVAKVDRIDQANSSTSTSTTSAVGNSSKQEKHDKTKKSSFHSLRFSIITNAMPDWVQACVERYYPKRMKDLLEVIDVLSAREKYFGYKTGQTNTYMDAADPLKWKVFTFGGWLGDRIREGSMGKDYHLIVAGDSPTDIAAGHAMKQAKEDGPSYVTSVAFTARPSTRMLSTQLRRFETDFNLFLQLKFGLGVSMWLVFPDGNLQNQRIAELHGLQDAETVLSLPKIGSGNVKTFSQLYLEQTGDWVEDAVALEPQKKAATGADLDPMYYNGINAGYEDYSPFSNGVPQDKYNRASNPRVPLLSSSMTNNLSTSSKNQRVIGLFEEQKPVHQFRKDHLLMNAEGQNVTADIESMNARMELQKPSPHNFLYLIHPEEFAYAESLEMIISSRKALAAMQQARLRAMQHQ